MKRPILLPPLLRILSSACLGFVLIIDAGTQNTHAQDMPSKDKGAAAYMGVGSCSSSNCHGSVSPRNASNVLQNEYVTWEKHDPHSKAWINLTNEESKKIAQNLNIKAADKEPLCLSCHATYLSNNERQSSNYHLEDGVSCESCHGAAENYLGPHTARDSTHAHNLEQGMADLASPQKRTKLCASCHFGGEDKYVDHRLIGAGHPRLTFELDTFGMIQPSHWVIDEDYTKRKGAYSPAKAWLTGQIHLGQKTTARLQSAKLSRHGMFPELTMFYCFACHHSLTEDQWKVRDYGGNPGELLLNVAPIIIAREGLSVLSPKLSGKLGSSLEGLTEEVRSGKTDSAKAISSQLEEAQAAVDKASFDKSTLEKLLKQLIQFGALTPHLQYEVAEQVAMGASAVISALSDEGTLFQSQVDAMYAALKNSEAFKAEEFTAACAAFAKKL